MRFVQFIRQSTKQRSLGVLVNSRTVADLTKTTNGSLQDFMHGLGLGNESLLSADSRAVKEVECHIPISDVNFLPPVTKPDKVLCVGLNYHDHAQEVGAAAPVEPIFFSKFSGTITSTGEQITIPKITENVDWEVELVIVIGKQAKNVTESEADDCIFGYTVANDVTARDWQMSKLTAGQWILGKSMDQFCPLAREIVTKDELPDLFNLKMTTHVNDVLKQNGSTRDMIFQPTKIVSYASKFFTFYPGDIILTGTPAGVGVGMKPPQFLQPGDTVTVEIENIGKCTNTFIKE